MSKYTFKAEDLYSTEITYSFTDEDGDSTVDKMLDHFASFLRAMQYSIDTLEHVRDDKYGNI